MNFSRQYSTFLAAIIFAAYSPCLFADDNIAASFIAKEQKQSEVMNDAFYLSDVHGPRWLASPAVHKAAEWVRKRLDEIGMADARLEGVGPVGQGDFVWSGQGWSYKRFSVNLLEPQYANLTAIPVPYSPSTPGITAGVPIRVDLPPPVKEQLETFFASERGKLRGRILLLNAARPIPLKNEAQFHRFTDAELEELAKPEAAKPSPAPAAAKPATPQPSFAESRSNYNLLYEFLKAEGVVAMLRCAGGESGNIFLSSPIGIPDPNPLPPPIIDVIPEQYNRIVRLLERGVPVKLDVELQAEFHEPREAVNVLAELRGSDPEAVVMVGAHLDSWHGGTGATDNGAGVAIVLEALRLVKGTGVVLPRTIRAGLWGLEEMGARGSQGYVRKHANEMPKVAYYINIDSGGGRVRGAYTGDVETAGKVREWLVPVNAAGAATVSPRIVMTSDHRNFHRAGVRVINLLQDPMHYKTRTHHSTMDVYDYLSPEDMKQAASVLATLLYKAASEPTARLQ